MLYQLSYTRMEFAAPVNHREHVAHRNKHRTLASHLADVKRRARQIAKASRTARSSAARDSA